MSGSQEKIKESQELKIGYLKSSIKLTIIKLDRTSKIREDRQAQGHQL